MSMTRIVQEPRPPENHRSIAASRGIVVRSAKNAAAVIAVSAIFALKAAPNTASPGATENVGPQTAALAAGSAEN
ncbi:MAG: hypothetical protein AAF224_13045 [Pseudomonadota bacterium]